LGKPSATAARWLATWFGCGLSPRAPGTLGSLGALPLHFLLCSLPRGVHGGLVLLTTGVGVWAAQQYAVSRGEQDPQRVVIDEVAGSLIAMGLVRDHGLGVQLAALVLFRVFDIWKPWPIRRMEHLKPLGVGIMFDDVLAGLIAGLLARLLP
jgi:phosphatidylglycerophosphatase A